MDLLVYGDIANLNTLEDYVRAYATSGNGSTDFPIFTSSYYVWPTHFSFVVGCSNQSAFLDLETPYPQWESSNQSISCDCFNDEAELEFIPSVEKSTHHLHNWDNTMGNVKKLIQTALKELHNASQHPHDQQWFTRATIGKHLKSPSGGLNPSRQSALEQLAQAGVVEQRHKPDEGKQTLEFRLKK